jgi:hypothetical protein
MPHALRQIYVVALPAALLAACAEPTDRDPSCEGAQCGDASGADTEIRPRRGADASDLGAADGAPVGDAPSTDAPADGVPCGIPEICNGVDDDCDGAIDEGGAGCIDVCCDDALVCLPIGCAPDHGECEDDNACWSDSFCEDGICLPYELVEGRDRDDTCIRDLVIDVLVPEVQCAWTAATDGVDPDSVHVMSTPMVVDFDFDNDPSTLRPSIVFATFSTAGGYDSPGTLRVIDGGTCAPQFSVEDVVMSPASVALGDIDLDGRADIVAATPTGGLVAFRYDALADALVQLWRSGTCADDGSRISDNTGGRNRWSGPSIHDLDNNERPEIIYGGIVYDADGCLRSTDAVWAGYSVGVVPVIADVDEDGIPEIIFGNAAYEWNPVTGQLVAETWFTGTANSAGQVAVAEMGEFPVAVFDGLDGPEVVVVSSGRARVQTIEGTIVFDVPIPGGGTGGPPTIADFDGDGRAEFATAGGSQYVVFDLDCVTGGDSAGCGGAARTDGVLWSQPSQDRSSNVTGSSVFDFDGDGAAEVVYADECYLRVYEGATGRVVYSAARSSGTTYENPIVVDVDGDFHTEIVSSLNDYASTACPTADPLRPETPYARGHGVVVLRDELDRWAASRPVWNQHAYSVTHVRDDGTIPRSGEVAKNWLVPELNNFRQNVQGELSALGIPDLTAAEDGDPRELECELDGYGLLEAQVCNRGMLPMGPGMVVAFTEGATDGPELCRATLEAALPIGTCEPVSCLAELAGSAVDVYVVIDPDGLIEECWEGNNFAFFGEVHCKA